MLSRNAFNALLKTLEEPPEHVKFVFATTEIRKVPVTVLSRCQRFDLRRIDTQVLAKHFAAIVEKEKAEVSEEALHLIARAADGSVRDGLSLLDQAISHGSGAVDAGQVRDMLGLADRTLVFDLFEAVMKGQVRPALEQVAEQYAGGADPALVLEDLAQLTHWVTRVKMVPEAADDPAVAEAERVRGKAMAETLGVPQLTRAWQMLLKGLLEVRTAPSPLQAAEMVIVRLAYAADLPSPADAVKMIRDGGGSAPAPAAPRPAPGAATAIAAPVPAPAPEARKADPRSFEDVVALTERHKAMILHANLINNIHLVRFEPGIIEFNPTEHASPSLANDLRQFLNEATERTWMVAVSKDPGAATLHQQHEHQKATAKAEVADHPLVQAVMATFPGSTIEEVRDVAVNVPPGDGEEDGGEEG